MLRPRRVLLMYETSHEIPYLYIRNSAPQDRGEQRPLRDGPIGQDRRRGLPLQRTLSYLCTRPQTSEQRVLGRERASGRGRAKGRTLELRPHDRNRWAEHGAFWMTVT